LGRQSAAPICALSRTGRFNTRLDAHLHHESSEAAN
jgi:hypothetical protein